MFMTAEVVLKFRKITVSDTGYSLILGNIGESGGYPSNNSRADNSSFEACRNAQHPTKSTWLYQLFRVRSDIYSNSYAKLDIDDLLVFLECITSLVLLKWVSKTDGIEVYSKLHCQLDMVSSMYGNPLHASIYVLYHCFFEAKCVT